MAIAPIALSDLTTAQIAGSGVFDVLMRAHKEHLDQEFTKGRIKGTEYATVYLGSLEAVLQNAVTFLLQKDKAALEAQLVQAQIALAEVERDKALAELAIVQASLPKVAAEIALLEAQAALTAQQTLNAVVENKVLVAQECKLRAEFDVLMESKLKTAEEKEVLKWKAASEKAQTTAMGVDDNSVIGKQKLLYAAQTDGFKRDAEQKAAKVMVDTWSMRRTTDSGVVADGTNKLDDASVGRAVSKLLAGVGA